MAVIDEKGLPHIPIQEEKRLVQEFCEEMAMEKQDEPIGPPLVPSNDWYDSHAPFPPPGRSLYPLPFIPDESTENTFKLDPNFVGSDMLLKAPPTSSSLSLGYRGNPLGPSSPYFPNPNAKKTECLPVTPISSHYSPVLSKPPPSPPGEKSGEILNLLMKKSSNPWEEKLSHSLQQSPHFVSMDDGSFTWSPSGPWDKTNDEQMKELQIASQPQNQDLASDFEPPRAYLPRHSHPYDKVFMERMVELRRVSLAQFDISEGELMLPDEAVSASVNGVQTEAMRTNEGAGKEEMVPAKSGLGVDSKSKVETPATKEVMEKRNAKTSSRQWRDRKNTRVRTLKDKLTQRLAAIEQKPTNKRTKEEKELYSKHKTKNEEKKAHSRNKRQELKAEMARISAKQVHLRTKEEKEFLALHTERKERKLLADRLRRQRIKEAKKKAVKKSAAKMCSTRKRGKET